MIALAMVTFFVDLAWWRGVVLAMAVPSMIFQISLLGLPALTVLVPIDTATAITIGGREQV